MVNAVRGEAEVKIGDVKITMVATMDRLAELSDALGNPTLQQLYARLYGTELVASRMAIRLLTTEGVRGEESLKARGAAEAALKVMTLSDMPDLQIAFMTVLSALLRPASDAGDKETGKDAASALN